MNLPATFSERMKIQLGDEYNAFLQALETPAPVSIRINPLKVDQKPELEPVPWAEYGFYLPERPSFTLDPLLHAGAYYVQEASSMFLEQAIKQSKIHEQPVLALDLCGAPGGKSTHLASVLHPDSLLVSNEVIKSRSNILAENVQKWGTGNAIVSNNDPRDFSRLPEFFDVMVVDAPCSGEGMFRKDPGAITEWSEANVKLCSERQQRILSDVWDALKPGGILVYSTCTFNPEENENNLAWLANEQEVEPIDLNIPDSWNIVREKASNISGYRFYPHRVKGEGLFMAVVRKSGTSEDYSFKKNKKTRLTLAGKNERALISGWLNQEEKYELVQENEKLIAFPSDWLQHIDKIYKELWVVYGGIEVAEIKKKNVNPLHALALSKAINKTKFEVYEVDYEAALRFLHKEDIALDGAPIGWILITYKDFPLGWMKKISNRTNNYYPKEWRIRMQIDEALKTDAAATHFAILP